MLYEVITGFEGTYTGKQVKVGETVRFLPLHCMMQKIHSGVVINIEDNKIKLEGRITSYNVCYTKLLRDSAAAFPGQTGAAFHA